MIEIPTSTQVAIKNNRVKLPRKVVVQGLFFLADEATTDALLGCEELACNGFGSRTIFGPNTKNPQTRVIVRWIVDIWNHYDVRISSKDLTRLMSFVILAPDALVRLRLPKEQTMDDISHNMPRTHDVFYKQDRYHDSIIITNHGDKHSEDTSYVKLEPEDAQ